MESGIPDSFLTCVFTFPKIIFHSSAHYLIFVGPVFVFRFCFSFNRCSPFSFFAVCDSFFTVVGFPFLLFVQPFSFFVVVSRSFRFTVFVFRRFRSSSFSFLAVFPFLAVFVFL